MSVVDLASGEEIRPLTHAQRDAILACRFRCRNVVHTMAYMLTSDRDTMTALISAPDAPFSATHYPRDSVTGTWEWEIKSSHPEAIELCGAS